MSPNRVTKPSDFISVLETLSDRWRWQFTFKSFVDIRHPICLCRSLILVSVMTFTEPWAQIFLSLDMGASRLSWATLSSNPSSVWNEKTKYISYHYHCLSLYPHYVPIMIIPTTFPLDIQYAFQFPQALVLRLPP